MTSYEISLAQALWDCSLLPGSSQKRFIRSMAGIATSSPDTELTLRQRHYMEILAWRYRRQLPRQFIPDRKPRDLPPPVKVKKVANETMQKKRSRKQRGPLSENDANIIAEFRKHLEQWSPAGRPPSDGSVALSLLNPQLDLFS